MSTQDPSQRPNLGKESRRGMHPGRPSSSLGARGSSQHRRIPGQRRRRAASPSRRRRQPTPRRRPAMAHPPRRRPAMAHPPRRRPATGTPTQGYAPAPVGYGIQGKTRGPWVVWLLSIITFGIYFLVWYYKINNEARQYDPRIDVEPGVSVLAIFPGSWIIVPPLISFYNTGKRIGQEQRAAGLPDTCNGWIGLIALRVRLRHRPDLLPVRDQQGAGPVPGRGVGPAGPPLLLSGASGRHSAGCRR